MNKSKKFHISNLVKSVISVFVVLAVAFASPAAHAVTLPDCTGAAGENPGTNCTQTATGTAKGAVTQGITAAGGSGTTGSTLTDLVKNIIDVLLFIAGAVAVIMIIVGGLRYITSNGDQAHVKAAKDTIMYAVVGLVVAILAYAIVQFVVSHL